jgi:hypothetical protein
VEIKLGGGKVLCDSYTKYAEKPEFVSNKPSMGRDKSARDHISSVGSIIHRTWGLLMGNR